MLFSEGLLPRIPAMPALLLARTIRFLLSGHPRFYFYQIFDSDAHRLHSILQDPVPEDDDRFFVFPSPEGLEVAIRLADLQVVNILWDDEYEVVPGEESMGEDLPVSIHCRGHNEPYTSRAADPAEVYDVFFFLEVGNAGEPFLRFVDEDGDTVFFRRDQILLMTAPRWYIADGARQIEADLKREPAADAPLEAKKRVKRSRAKKSTLAGMCLLASTAVLTQPSPGLAQDSTASRPQAELAREADSIRAAYADSVSSQAATSTQPVPSQEPVATPVPVNAPDKPRQSLPGEPSLDLIARAIVRGQKAKDQEGIGGGSTVLMKQGRGYDVSLTGPLNRVANAARAASQKYLPYTADSVPPTLVKSVVIITAYPRKPQLMSGSWKQTPPATHLVLRPKEAAKGSVIQPSSVTTFEETWGNAYGAKFQGQGVRAEFPISSVPSTDFDVLVITASNEYKIGIKAKTRSRLQ